MNFNCFLFSNDFSCINFVFFVFISYFFDAVAAFAVGVVVVVNSCDFGYARIVVVVHFCPCAN